MDPSPPRAGRRVPWLDEAQDATVVLSQQILAAMLGVRRPSLNKILKGFERRGLIGLGYRTIDIHAPDELARVATGRADRPGG